MRTILFYSSYNSRARDAESIMLALRSRGHRVISLSQYEGLFIHDYLKDQGIETFSYVVPEETKGWRNFVLHLIFFVKFCWKYRVNMVFSHLELPNFVAVVGQFFIKSKVFICRHHIDEAALYKFDNKLSYKLTNKLSKKIIVVSEQAKKYMIEQEKILSGKIEHINLAYDFSLYKLPRRKEIEEVRKKFPTDLLLVTVCRLTPYKRPDEAVRLLKELWSRGFEAKLVILGRGEMEKSLKEMVVEWGLQKEVFLPGHVSNVLDYLAAADFVVHPSLLESSCVVVKEAGLVNKPVIVCKGIGDFDSYLKTGVNGFSVEPSNFVNESADIIQRTLLKSERLGNIGKNLNQDITRLFCVNQIIKAYEALIGDRRQ